ncbi:hypothetical protein VTJ83DRAFT_500 [Remersonia thermophila]|uniref:Mediator of RNA polymerase II transcription subunit 14 n=1 Tax=Remersonia thermophila TaxID=72144 RepID=A0ABR4DM32_9PEZI
MEYSMHSDKRAENDRAPIVNGVKEEGASIKREDSPSGKGFRDAPAMAGENGRDLKVPPDAKLGELPDEIQHITAEIMPLGLLLSRLAQFSHGRLQELVLNLASKPLPEVTANGGANGNAAGGVNGNLKSAVNGQLVEDTSPESLEKKTMILNTIKDLHSRWVKALVITEWSRNAEEVGKLIDLRQHLAIELERYTRVFWDMIKVKDEMVYAKVPSPDLKTALEVLGGRAVHWMPDFGYLPDPPLKAEEKLHWLNEIDVTLHMRLQLHEFENLPSPWRKYAIDNGRVTFTVPGEFEVDLTIFDEEFENSQFWFLDFRPLFHPAPPELSERARAYVEAQANTLLRDEGLSGCYNFLHELTLTTKIGEFERQANLLRQSGLWIGSLKVERLNRCLSIQYWAQSAGPSSWIILGVNSGKPSEGFHDPGTPSHLTAQWFRDGKRVDDTEIPFDADNISVEQLLMTVISKHVDFLLSSIYAKLAAKPRYAQREGRLALQVSAENPLSSQLSMRLLGQEDAVLRLSPWTGFFNFLNPPPALVRDWRLRFNSMKNRVEDAPIALERFRCFYTADRLRARAEESGWEVLHTAPLPLDEVKNQIFKRAPASREGVQLVWLRNTSWDPSWFAILSMSLGGDRWWLIEVLNRTAEARETHAHGKYINTFAEIQPPTDLLHQSRVFFEHLSKHTASIMAQIKALRTPAPTGTPTGTPGPVDRIPGDASLSSRRTMARVRISHLLAPKSASDKPRSHAWAQEFVIVEWKGLAPAPISGFQGFVTGTDTQQQRSWSRVMVEAKLAVANPVKFTLLQRTLDRDVFYDPKLGQFTLRFQPEIGEDVIPLLEARIRVLSCLADIVDALKCAGKAAVAERITLSEVAFTYGLPPPSQAGQQPPANPEKYRRWKAIFKLSKDGEIDVILERGNPHLRVKDYLRVAANGASTLKRLPRWFVFTLPLFQTLERVQDTWDVPFSKAQGACYVFHKTLDWVALRFTLSGAATRRVHIDIKARNRGGNLFWHVSRPKTDANADNENDEFNKLLKQRVWSASGKGFKGLLNSAAASWDGGIDVLLTTISDTILTLVGTPPPQYLLQQLQQPPQRLQTLPPGQDHQQQLQLQQQHQQLQLQQQQQQQHPQPVPLQQQPGSQARFAHHPQQQQGYPPPHIQQPRMLPPQLQQQQHQQHMAQLAAQGQAQGQPRGPGGGMTKNAQVVVLE